MAAINETDRAVLTIAWVRAALTDDDDLALMVGSHLTDAELVADLTKFIVGMFAGLPGSPLGALDAMAEALSGEAA